MFFLVTHFECSTTIYKLHLEYLLMCEFVNASAGPSFHVLSSCLSLEKVWTLQLHFTFELSENLQLCNYFFVEPWNLQADPKVHLSLIICTPLIWTSKAIIFWDTSVPFRLTLNFWNSKNFTSSFLRLRFGTFQFFIHCTFFCWTQTLFQQVLLQCCWVKHSNFVTAQFWQLLHQVPFWPTDEFSHTHPQQYDIISVLQVLLYLCKLSKCSSWAHWIQPLILQSSRFFLQCLSSSLRWFCFCFTCQFNSFLSASSSPLSVC